MHRTSWNCRYPRSSLDMGMPRSEDAPESMTGVVDSFDAHRGLGRIVCTSGESLMFHCVEIADGTRSIEIGTPVEFERRMKFSRPEAFSVRSREG